MVSFTLRVAGCLALGDGLRHHGRDAVAADGDADDDPRGPTERSQILRTIEDEVGRPGQEQLVLVAGRLALHAVDQQRPARAGRHGRPQA